MERVGGIIQLKTSGEIQDAKGEFTYNLGLPKREAVLGIDSVHGYKDMPQVAFIEGVITDRSTLKLRDLVSGTGLTITLRLANGKTIVLGNAWFAGDGEGSTSEGEIKVRWESKQQGKEV